MRSAIGLLCSSMLVVGCLSPTEDPATPQAPEAMDSKVTEEQIEYLVSQGFDRDNIEIREDGVILEGDIFVPQEEISNRSALMKKSQRVNGNLVGVAGISTVRVRIDPSLSGYAAPIQGALNRWNRIDSRLNMVVVTTNPHITIYSDEAASCPSSHRNLGSSTAGMAGFPGTNGLPFPTVSLNLNTTLYPNMTMAIWEMIILHELGHNIGLHHTDGGGGTHLAGTPGSDGPSIMNSGSTNTAVPNLTGVSYWDARTLRMIYPANAGNISAIYRTGANNKTEIHVLNRANNFQGYLINIGTALGTTNGNWDFPMEDFNNDGNADIYAITRAGASGMTEVHVVNGAGGYQGYLLNIATALHQTNGNWEFALGDYNNDGIMDIYAINRSGASSKTEVHVLNGANNFQGFLANISTALHPTNGNWEFAIGDYNLDGLSDIYAINRSGASSKTEVHVLNGANNFQGFLANIATALHPTDANWDFMIADHNGDGLSDIYAINRVGASNKTEAHILNGANGFAGYLANTATALGVTNGNWGFY